MGNSKVGRQHSHNMATGKYVKQRARTEANKRKKLEKHRKKNPNDKKE